VRQEGSIKLVRKGQYEARFRDADDRDRRKRGFSSRAEAQEWLTAQLDIVKAQLAGTYKEPREALTVAALVDELIAGHTGSAGTIATLSNRLKRLVDTFGDRQVASIRYGELRSWFASVPEGSRWGIGKAVRQLFNYAVADGQIAKSPAADLDIGSMPRADVETLTIAEVDAIDAELPRHLRGLVILMAETGLRPEEVCGLDVADVDRQAGTLTVRRRYVGGQVLPGLKTTSKSKKGVDKRDVPLTPRALAALDARKVTRLSPILFPGRRGGRLDWHHFRGHVWTPTLEGLGLRHRTPYALRHTFVTRALDAGVAARDVARVAGTSEAMIEHTYDRGSEVDAGQRLVAALAEAV
jgi:integrase